MDLLDRNTFANVASAAAHLRQLIPRRLAFIGLGIFGAGLGLGVLVGAVGHRAFARNFAANDYEA